MVNIKIVKPKYRKIFISGIFFVQNESERHWGSKVKENQIEGFLLQFSNWNKWKVLGLMIVIDQVFSLLLLKLIEYVVRDDVFVIDSSFNESLFSIFFLYVLFTPIMETLICQLIIMEVILFIFNRLRFKNSILFSVTISGLVFGLGHSYNWYYVFVTFIIGILYGVYYLIAKKHKHLNPFWTVALIHSIWNLISFIIYDIYKI